MARVVIRYTPEQLHRLHDSPLVHKPDGLPSIEQWMETTSEQNGNGRRPRSQVMRDNEQPSNGEARTERPPGMGMGYFTRRSSTQPEDTVLGPPKLSFTSASRTAKPSDSTEKRPGTSQESDSSTAERSSVRERFFKERDSERSRDKTGFTNGRRGVREDGEGWTNVKSRKSLGQEDVDRGHRNGERDKDRYQKDGDVDDKESTSRRMGIGRGRFDQPWSREDPGTKDGEGAKAGTRGQGWRDRERDRDRDRDREWNRGGRIEEDPEWLDSPTKTEKKQAHTQEDFQRWKERMKAGATPAEEKESAQDQPPTATEPVITPAGTSSAATSKPATPLALDGGLEKLFGMWGEGKRSESTGLESTVISKVNKAKPKPSRFAGLFAPPEEPAKQTQAQPPAPSSPGPAANGSNEDKEGFQRILQMLGGTNIPAQPNVQQENAPSNATRQGAMRMDYPQPQPEERLEGMQPPRQQVPRTREERNAFVDAVLAPRPSAPDSRSVQAMFTAMSPGPEPVSDQYRSSRPESSRPSEDFMMQPPSRNGNAQDALNLQALLGGRASQEPPRDSKRDFLLTLMQPSRATPPQMLNQNMPRHAAENPNYSLYMDNNTPKGQALPKSRALPPGIFDDPRVFAENEMLRREASMREVSMREASMRDSGMPQPEALRKPVQRLPPGIFDDPSIASLQRRNTTENMPRQMTNMGIPQQPVSDIPPWMKNPGMPQPPQERNIAPPPGFGPGGMRQPPGFGGPQNGPQSQMGPFSTGNTPLGHPGMPPPRGMGGPGGMYPGQVQSQMPPQGPPQGYFSPPGFPPMGIQRDDPRMMMGGPLRRPEYDQFGDPQQQGRPTGRPPGMFNMQ
ncbi:hypothetical protein AOQ84DRAFT_55965 [Glonium stellatum]|uniref:Uncharacterized protein n=1 Tax=Glonium stellatum TaxID=574774 RepID=A0A8E2FBH8_9PEZI|nr:hypothetical protein AOQ84DRAFT_55965 [Glonium stellatum]